MPKLSVGMVVRVKADVWREWCIRHQTFTTEDVSEPPPVQPITSTPTHSPFCGYVMLAFPFYWWREDELEVVDQ
jgi:hypothetical protein